jgi:hypothetical protein
MKRFMKRVRVAAWLAIIAFLVLVAIANPDGWCWAIVAGMAGVVSTAFTCDCDD